MPLLKRIIRAGNILSGVAATYGTYTMAAPLLWYKAASLATTTTSVTSWPNLGSLGNPFDLTVESGYTGPDYFPQGGMSNDAYVNFTNGRGLRTLNTVPFSGQDYRVILACVNISPDGGSGYRNFFGTGTPDLGKLADMAMGDDDRLYMHQYYQGTYTVLAQRGVWAVIGYVITTTADSSNVFSAYALINQTTSETNANGAYQVDNPATPLRVGIGYYDPWNTGIPHKMRELRAYGYLSRNQIVAAINQMLTS